MFQKIQKGNKIRSIRQWEELVLDRKKEFYSNNWKRL